MFKNTQWDGIQMTGEKLDGSELIVNNCTFVQASQRYIHVEPTKNANADIKVTITNNKFEHNPIYYARRSN